MFSGRGVASLLAVEEGGDASKSLDGGDVKTFIRVRCQEQFEPPELFGHSATLDPSFGGRMFVFSGSDATGRFASDLWTFEVAQRRWNKLTVSIEEGGPSGRHFHSGVLYDRSVWIFGGISNGIHQDLYRYNIVTGKWSAVATLGTSPSPRYGHSAVVYNDCMYVYGGYDRMGFVCNDLFELSFKTLSWEKPAAAGAVPKESYHHTAVVYQGSMYVFGGYRKAYNEILEYRFATKAWSFLKTTGNSPKPRWGHTAVVFGQFMYVFGGRDRVANFHDLYCLNFDTQVWRRVECEGIDGRFHCSAVVMDDWMYVFGGSNIHSFSYNDTTRCCLKEWSALHDDSIVEDLQLLVGDAEFADIVFVMPSDKVEETEFRATSSAGALTTSSNSGTAAPSSLPAGSASIIVPEEFSGCKKIFAHKFIVSGRSAALDVMLKADMVEGRTGVVVMRDVKAAAVRALLVYLYTDALIVESEYIMDTMNLANQWQLPHLFELCQERMLRYISLENAVPTFVKARELEANVLFEACRLFLNKNSTLLPAEATQNLTPMMVASIENVGSPTPSKRRAASANNNHDRTSNPNLLGDNNNNNNNSNNGSRATSPIARRRDASPSPQAQRK